MRHPIRWDFDGKQVTTIGLNDRRSDPAMGFREATRSLGQSPWTARWQGTLAAPLDGTYTFEVRTTDGRTFAARVDVPKGDPGNPLTRAELEAKAIRLAEFRGGATEDEMRAATLRIWKFDTEAQVGRLLS